MHSTPAGHSAELTQSCAAPVVAVEVVGAHAPGATFWHAVFAPVMPVELLATPQHTLPASQSMAPRQEKAAWGRGSAGQAIPWGTHEPWRSWSTQQVLVLSQQSDAPD